MTPGLGKDTIVYYMYTTYYMYDRIHFYACKITRSDHMESGLSAWWLQMST